MKDTNGNEGTVDGIFLDHYQWKEPVRDSETGLINLLTPHSDGMEYEYSIDFLFLSTVSAAQALIDWDVLDEAIENNWVLVKVSATMADIDLSLLK